MKRTLKKLTFAAVFIFAVAAMLAISAFAADLKQVTGLTEYTAAYGDLTYAKGYIQIATTDDESPDIIPDANGVSKLVFFNTGDVYFNEASGSLVIVAAAASDGGGVTFGDGTNAAKNGGVTLSKWWPLSNGTASYQTLVKSLEFRGGLNIGWLIRSMNGFVNLTDIKADASVTQFHCANSLLFGGAVAMKSFGHGTWDAAGVFTPTTYKENEINLTGFTHYTGATSFVIADGIKNTFYHYGNIAQGAVKVVLWKDLKHIDETKGGYEGGIIADTMFKGISTLNTVVVPEGVTFKSIGQSAFEGCVSLRCITVKGSLDAGFTVGKDAFKDVMDGCVIQCSSQADIDKMNAALTAAGVTTVKAVDMNTQPTEGSKVNITKIPAAPAWKALDTTGATATGFIKSTYANNVWAFFADTKTLMIESVENGGGSYNESGSLSSATDAAGWIAYKDQIEHVVFGPGIHKLSSLALSDHTALKDIKATSKLSQCHVNALTGCTSLTTIWIDGMEKVEGQAFLGMAKTNFQLNLKDTAVKTIHMASSPVAFMGNITPAAATEALIFDVPVMDLLSYCEENYINLESSAGEVIGEFYVPVDLTLPLCGNSAVYSFDEKTGTLTISGKGAVGDVENYWGGGSKNQFWFDIKHDIKHVIIGDYITTIGKYAFTECENLETVQLPAKDGFVILNAAFEDCYNLKSIYVKGSQPIEGTADLSTIHEFESYTFADNYMLANVVINENVSKIGSSVFDNCVNLQNIYGVPGSFAEEYATKNEFTFFDKAANTPQPIKCEPPAETTEPIPETTEPSPETTDPAPETTLPAPDTTVPAPETDEPTPETKPVSGGEDDGKDKGGSALPVIIVIVVVVAVAVVAAVIIIAKKKAPKAEKKD